MKKNKSGISISNDTMQYFIWMSYRYCIGRKTAAAAMHADSIARLLRDNPNILTYTDMLYMSQDIQAEILDVIKWQPRISINGFIGDNKGFDWYGGLLYSSNNVEGDPYEYEYKLDFHTNTIQAFRAETKSNPSEYFDQDYNDLIGWYKLAKVLDKRCHRKLICECEEDGKQYREEIIAIPFPMKKSNGKYEECWMDIDDVCLTRHVYIAPEHIKEIKTID